MPAPPGGAQENSRVPALQDTTDYPTWRQLALRCLFLLLYPIAFISIYVMQRNAALAEAFYASVVFPAIRNAVAAVSYTVPFSVAEVLVAACVVILAALSVVCVAAAVRRRLILRRLLSWLLTLLIVVGVGLNAFYWMWGFNYHRETLGERLGIDTETVLSPAQLRELCFALADAANTARASVREDTKGVFEYDVDYTEMMKKIPTAFERLGQVEEIFSEPVYAPKTAFASGLMSSAGIAGIFIPFTEEAHVSIAGTPLLIAASAAHEASHYLGIAREGEANVAAFLACTSSPDPQVRYSGYMMALIYAGNALAEIDQQSYAELWQRYSPGVVRDMAANNEYVESHEGKLSDTVNEVNDSYLRGNAQPSGVRSYGEMVDLLGAYIRERNYRTPEFNGLSET